MSRKYTDEELGWEILKLLRAMPRGQRLAQLHDALFDSFANDVTTLQWNIERKQLNGALQTLRKADKIFYFSPPVGWRLR